MKTLHEIEKETILQYLKEFRQNKTHTAKALGISIRTLRNKLIEYGVQAPQRKASDLAGYHDMVERYPDR